MACFAALARGSGGRDSPPVDERALRAELATVGEQVLRQDLPVQVAHRDAVADAAEAVDRAAVRADVAERRGEVSRDRERAAPAVCDLDPGQVRPQPAQVLLQVPPRGLVAIAVEVARGETHRAAADDDPPVRVSR